MKEVLNLIETHTKLYEEIIQKALDFEQLQERQQTLEIENGRKLKELQSIQSVLLQSEENQQDLTSRNGVLRDKFSELDENVKNKAKGISAELKRLCKQLGIKVKIEQSDQVNEEIFSLKFSESKEHEITFIYDLITEDYNRKLRAKIFNE